MLKEKTGETGEYFNTTDLEYDDTELKKIYQKLEDAHDIVIIIGY